MPVMFHASRWAVLSLAAVTFACSSRTVGTTPSPDNGSTVKLWLEDLDDTSNAIALWAENTGKVSVVITELRLHSCVNLRQDCDLHAPNVTVEPGQRGVVARLDPSNSRERPRFRYEYQWRTVRTTVATAPNVAAVRSVMIDRGVLESIDIADWRSLVVPRDEGGECVSRLPQMGEGRMAGMFFAPPGMMPVRAMMLTLDASGRIVSVSDTRNGWERALGSAPRDQRDPLGPRTVVAVDVLRGTALLMNEAVGVPPERHHVEATNLLDAPTLGPLRAVAERVARECGVQAGDPEAEKMIKLVPRVPPPQRER